jgi:hypothetical protein
MFKEFDNVKSNFNKFMQFYQSEKEQVIDEPTDSSVEYEDMQISVTDFSHDDDYDAGTRKISLV